MANGAADAVSDAVADAVASAVADAVASAVTNTVAESGRSHQDETALAATSPHDTSGAQALDSAQCVRGCILTVSTRQSTEFIDVTCSIETAIQQARFAAGVVALHTRHTTMGLLVNEHEPLLLQDLQALFERLAPATAHYAHDDFDRRMVNMTPGERRNGHAHCRAALLRSSETLAVRNGRLDLGRWQRVFLVEFDGPQRRELGLTMMGTWTPDDSLPSGATSQGRGARHGPRGTDRATPARVPR
jgi:secondary thiamine-phosphate synthase enzyme